MVEEEIARKGDPIDQHGKPLHVGTIMQIAIQTLITLPQGPMDVLPNKTLTQHGTMPFQDYRQFINLCDKSTPEGKAKLSKFYLHNLALTYLNVWDPNAKLGDLQLMAFASWMSHEGARAKQVKRIV